MSESVAITDPARRPASPRVERGLYRNVFTTEGLTEEEKRWAYAVSVDSAIVTTPLTPSLRAVVEGWMLGPVGLICADCSPRSSERTAALAAKDGWDPLSVQLTLAGRASGDAAGRRVTTGPGDMLFLDVTKPFVMTDADDRRGVTAVIPRSMLKAIRPQLPGLHGLVLGPERNAILAEHLRAILPVLPALPNSAGATMARVLVDLLTLTLHPLRSKTAPDVWPTLARGDAAMLARAQAFIDANLTEPEFSPDMLAGMLNLSRSKLYKLFESSGGVSQQIWSRRLAAVRDALLDPFETRSISELALSFGFGSETAFSRAFRAAYGVTASELRRRADDGQASEG